MVERGGLRAIAKRPAADVAAAAAGHATLAREAWALSLSPHPRIPALLEHAEDAAGPFVVQELVVGTALPRAVPRRAAAGLARQLLELVGALHARGERVVHGDLAPSNLLLTAGGALHLIDFSAAGSDLGVPHAPRGRGTLPFAAPELCRGETRPSQATDRYAAALLVAELLGGVRTTVATSEPAMLLAIAERGHELVALEGAGLPAPLTRELGALLAFEPAARPACLTGLSTALDDWVDSGGVTS